MVTDLCSIGTLFAFVLVCAGVLVLQNKPNIQRGKFKTPYINSKYIMPVLFIATIIFSYLFNKEASAAFLSNQQRINTPTTIVTSLNANDTKAVYNYLITKDNINKGEKTIDIEAVLDNYYKDEITYADIIASMPINDNLKYESGWQLFKHKIPLWIFIFISIGLTVWAYKENLSLIPMLGLISCLYMMAELGLSNWIGFGIWLVVGLFIYFIYSRKNSKLNDAEQH
jgi:quinol-cytochrome oxidoreductase complex cytochrome b subunit